MSGNRSVLEIVLSVVASPVNFKLPFSLLEYNVVPNTSPAEGRDSEPAIESFFTNKIPMNGTSPTAIAGNLPNLW